MKIKALFWKESKYDLNKKGAFSYHYYKKAVRINNNRTVNGT